MTSGWLFRLGGLGDLLVALPSIRLIRSAFPEKILVLVGRRPYAILLKEAGLIDEAASGDGRQWSALFGAEVDEAAAVRPEPEFVFGWFHGTAASSFERNARRLAPHSLVGVFRADPSARLPLWRSFFGATAAFLRARGRATVPPEDCLRLPISQGQINRGRALLGTGAASARIAVVHPGSGSRSKCWPPDRFRSVISHLAAQGSAGAVVTGEADHRLEPEIAAGGLPEGWIWLSHPRLSDLAGLLAAADVYLGNDSGVTHLAAACGARVVALFRDEFEAAWRPAGDVFALSAPEVSAIPIDDVLRALESRLDIFGPTR